jgi:hypothetical protein
MNVALSLRDRKAECFIGVIITVVKEAFRAVLLNGCPVAERQGYDFVCLMRS